MKNHLANEASPYLLQHKDNPIHWFAWGEEAFRAARERDVPIFLSIGYSTCHWCHVMAHESFEDTEVAAALNQGFVNIKVDREERPDVDDLYMRGLQALSGGGGWPMSVWLTPDGKPFFAGTYFPKHRFLQLLRRVGEVWMKDRPALQADGEKMLSVIKAAAENEAGDGEASATEADQREFLARYISHFQHVFDETYGGFGQAPKFPQTMNLMLMMRQDFKTGLNQAETMVTRTLEHMLRGGIYDHLRGGFHRYSVDQQWLVPHFEKMLYDQALITVTLLEANALYPNAEFERAARETCDYVLREMTAPDGGFYSAQDADSLDPATKHMEEGFFATYSYAELEQALSTEELAALTEIYSVSKVGHYEGRNILHLAEGSEGVSAKQRPDIRSAFAKLESLRAQKPAPHLDDKVLVSWNGWMIWALTRAARVFNEERYAQAAERAWSFLTTRLWVDGRLRRFWREGHAHAAGTAEDYAALVLAGIELCQIRETPELVAQVLKLQDQLDREFWDETSGTYFTNDGRDPHLPYRTREQHDGVTPSANSMSAYNHARLYTLTGEIRHRERATRLIDAGFTELQRYPSGLPFLGLAIDWRLARASVAVWTPDGEWPHAIYATERTRLNPHRLWAKADPRGWPIARDKTKAGIYICEDGQCLNPSTSREAAHQALAER